MQSTVRGNGPDRFSAATLALLHLSCRRSRVLEKLNMGTLVAFRTKNRKYHPSPKWCTVLELLLRV